jgi:hypothetical protein
MNFNDLAKTNVDHYNDHPVAHTALAVAALVGAVVLIKVAAKRLSKENPNLKSGLYARI